jgi:hypothetical protein
MTEAELHQWVQEAALQWPKLRALLVDVPRPAWAAWDPMTDEQLRAKYAELVERTREGTPDLGEQHQTHMVVFHPVEGAEPQVFCMVGHTPSAVRRVHQIVGLMSMAPLVIELMDEMMRQLATRVDKVEGDGDALRPADV